MDRSTCSVYGGAMAVRKGESIPGPWLTSSEAASRLGVHRATLYAYVSRGLIRSAHAPDDPRARRYAAEDVERMRLRGGRGRDEKETGGSSVYGSVPVLETSITLIDGSALF
ncbi:MAG: helix-turn-helix domain-containing protein, partial [Thermoanaerobaculia bacterium]